MSPSTAPPIAPPMPTSTYIPAWPTTKEGAGDGPGPNPIPASRTRPEAKATTPSPIVAPSAAPTMTAMRVVRGKVSSGLVGIVGDASARHLAGRLGTAPRPLLRPSHPDEHADRWDREVGQVVPTALVSQEKVHAEQGRGSPDQGSGGRPR